MLEQKEYSGFIDFDLLTLNMDDIYLSMGKGYIPDKEVISTIDFLIKRLRIICKPQYLFIPYYGEVNGNKITIDNKVLSTGKIITPFLKNSEQYILFVVTAGISFQNFQNEVHDSGDVFMEFLLDSIGSEIVEASVRYICDSVKRIAEGFLWGTSFPYSPGYCGWKLSDQSIFFSLLPYRPCGIELTESFLMYPIKSVSGILAVGNKILPQKYGCEICKKKDCYKNRLKK